MRVLLVHEYYRERGGEDVAFETDARLLSDAGHAVDTLAFDNAEIRADGSLKERWSLLKSTIWSDESAARVRRAVALHQPDVVHFHNTFPLVSPSAFGAAKQQGAAVVATVHNYRLVCPNASLFRDGHVCEDCLRAPLPLPGVINACYRGSRGQSAAVASMLVFHRLRRTWLRDVDRLISPSRFLRSKLAQGGIPAAKIAVRPNAVTPAPSGRVGPGDGFLYVGRLAQNKGIGTLLRAWETSADLPPLLIAGAGEMESRVRAAASARPGRITYRGTLEQDAVMAEMGRARALVFPSVWYENQPMTVLEAFSSGLPVICSRLGAMTELVRDGETGLLFPPGDAGALQAKVEWARAHPDEMAVMGDRARAAFEERFSPRASLAALVSIYEDVVRLPIQPVGAAP